MLSVPGYHCSSKALGWGLCSPELPWYALQHGHQGAGLALGHGMFSNPGTGHG